MFAPDQKDWVPITSWSDSCPPVDKNHLTVLTFNQQVTIGWTDSVGGKFTGKVKGEVFKQTAEAGFEVNYQHSVTQTDTWSTGYTYTIPYDYRSALYLQHGMLTATGDFAIITGNGDRFLVKNATFTFPLAKDVQVEGRGQPILRGYVHHTDIPCEQKPPVKGVPPPTDAKIGLAAPIK